MNLQKRVVQTFCMNQKFMYKAQQLLWQEKNMDRDQRGIDGWLLHVSPSSEWVEFGDGVDFIII